MPTLGVLTTSYPCTENPVAGFFVRGMARALTECGWEVEVLAPEPKAGSLCQDEGISPRPVRYAPAGWRQTFYGDGVPDNVRQSARAWPGLMTFPAALTGAALQRVQRWDAIVSHWALPSALAAGLVRGKRPHLAVLHSADVHLLRRLPGRTRWTRRIARSATDLLFASNALRKEMLSWLPPVVRANVSRRAHASAMGIEVPAVDASRAQLRERWSLHRPTVLSLGRLVPIKGLDHAVDAVAREDVELLIVGDGSERTALEARARRRGAPVRFLGVRTGAEKAELLHAADFFLAPHLDLPSGRTEGTPTSVLEAAAAGLPIIASPAGGIPEVLKHEHSALLVAPNEVRAALRRLLEDPSLARSLGKNARRTGRRFAWARLAPRIDELLRR